jgi:hypothetical protein
MAQIWKKKVGKERGETALKILRNIRRRNWVGGWKNSCIIWVVRNKSVAVSMSSKMKKKREKSE